MKVLIHIGGITLTPEEFFLLIQKVVKDRQTSFELFLKKKTRGERKNWKSQLISYLRFNW